jgi:hypothetical protein
MIFLFGFGYAKPVEVRMRKFKKPKRVPNVPVKPIKSAPRQSRKIFLEKKDNANVKK